MENITKISSTVRLDFVCKCGNIGNKKHRYFIDIYIPNLNKMIEVKIEYTLNKYKENVLLKANECVKQGYDYEIWIYDYKKNKNILTSFSTSTVLYSTTY